MLTYSRRHFLKAGGGLLAGGLFHQAAFAAQKTADSVRGPIRITDIEVHDITVDYEDWIAYPLNHYYGPTKRTVYVVHTDKGLTGLGEGSREPDEVIEKYIGTSPFDWVGDETSLRLGTAMYDLMGKAAGVPVYKLFGQRYRAWVPVGSWTYRATSSTWSKPFNATRRRATPGSSITSRLLRMSSTRPRRCRPSRPRGSRFTMT